MWRKRVLLRYWWECNLVQPLEISQKIKNRTTLCPSNSMTGYISEGKSIRTSKRGLHSHVSLFIIVKIWEQPKCPLTDAWIKKKWDNGIVFSSKKKKEILFLTTWMNLASHHPKWKYGREWQILYLTFMPNLKKKKKLNS